MSTLDRLIGGKYVNPRLLNMVGLVLAVDTAVVTYIIGLTSISVMSGLAVILFFCVDLAIERYTEW